ncbi:17564_t:CDS:2, partial [Gigaspora margarita]
LLNVFNNANVASITQSMLVYEQQNNKFNEIRSFELGINKKEAKNYPTTISESDKRKLVVITGATGDIGFNIAKAFLKYGCKKYAIKVIRHTNSEYFEEEKLKRENRAKKLAEKGANVELVNYNKYDELVKALTGASFVVSAL